MINVFDNYSVYYNLLYEDKDYKKEAAYIASLLGNFRNVLELGCGTGKHAKLLCEKGYTIYGIDMSETMLFQAKQLGVNCEVGDVRTFRFDKTFDAVVSLFHVASYQTSDEDVNKFFETARFHLKIGGKFIFDVWHKDAVLAQVPEKRVKTFENDKVKVVRYCVPNHIKEKDMVEVNYTIEINDKSNVTIETFQECHQMRYFSFDDINKFACKNGFKILKSEEWLTKNKPSIESWGVCYECEAI